MRKVGQQVRYSPSDLIRFWASPFASWMDRLHLESPAAVTPDEDPADKKLFADAGTEHERAFLSTLENGKASISKISSGLSAAGRAETLQALAARTPIVYQAALEDDRFSGLSDFVMLNDAGDYEVWDTKLALSPKPYYAIQLCCYTEMLAAIPNIGPFPKHFGVILGNGDRVRFRTEDFVHLYREVRRRFLGLQDAFTTDMAQRPEPLPGADHGRWASHAEAFFTDRDHLVQIAGISVGQIKKLRAQGIHRMEDLATKAIKTVPKLAEETLAKLKAQAELQCQTRSARATDEASKAAFRVLPPAGPNGEPLGLALLPPANAADVYFDMEGYPLVPGGLEYLFGAAFINGAGRPEFKDWWAHSRGEEKQAFEAFIDWIYGRWKANSELHVYHYAAYEVTAMGRLSTRHDTRQDEVDELLRAKVFVDLHRVVRQGLLIGEPDYSLKTIEHLYRPKRTTTVATAADSIVQYANWIASKEPSDWNKSAILKGIRDYNEDDCFSTLELTGWLRSTAASQKVASKRATSGTGDEHQPKKPLPAEVVQRHKTIEQLRAKGDPVGAVLADLLDFHRREQKPVWWRMFDRADATEEQLRDDPGCIQGVVAKGAASPDKKSQVQAYAFDPDQECKLVATDRTKLMFTFDLDPKFGVPALDLDAGAVQLKIGNKALGERFGGRFPRQGSLIPYEFVGAEAIQNALTAAGEAHLAGKLNIAASSLLQRTPPTAAMQGVKETPLAAAVRIAPAMAGGCLVVQGPPGTGKTYTAAEVIVALLEAGKKVGIASNSHKAVMNLLAEGGKALRARKKTLRGLKVGGERDPQLLAENRDLQFVDDNKDAQAAYGGGVIGGTAWLFTLPDWVGKLDYLFIDEAGQVSLANAIAMSRVAPNLVLLGDQMQLEQPIQGTHPGDAGLSSLQYALKDLAASKEDAPEFYPVVPAAQGLFLAESHRMHPAVCSFISETVYEGRLQAHPDCSNQRIAVPASHSGLISQEFGVVFLGVEHDGNIQQSDEEVAKVVEAFQTLKGRPFTASDGKTHPLALEDLLFIAPYNAQVRSLQSALPKDARVGSVDKFQGQQASVCILSLCSSYGEYGARGLRFILDRNRINVALSRAKCLAVVVGDPRIASGTANSIDEMKLLNTYCKIASCS